MSIQEILESALTLHVDERAALAEQLLASLDDLSDEDAAHLWADEAQRRLNAYRAGRSKTTSSDEVHARAAKLLGD